MSIRRGADVHFVVSLHDFVGFLAMSPGIVIRARVELTITARRESFAEPAPLIAFQHPLNSTFGATSAACQPAGLRLLFAAFVLDALRLADGIVVLLRHDHVPCSVYT